jgi:preprotein translocase subunit SecF
MNFFYVFDPKKPRDLLGRGKMFVIAGFVFAMVQLLLVFTPMMHWGIDFSGGVEMQVRFEQSVQSEAIRAVLNEQGFDKNQVQAVGSTGLEYLVRVQRAATLTKSDVEQVRAAVSKVVGADVTTGTSDTDGDRVTLSLPAPAIEDIVAQAKFLDEQQVAIGSAIEQLGFRLRRTVDDAGVVSTSEAIVRDEPYQGRMKMLVQLQGVSDKVSTAMAAKLGKLEVRRVDFVDAQVAQQLKQDGIVALLVTLLLILVYVAVRFDIFFAPGALIALAHDPLGAFVVFTLMGMDFDMPAVAAMLTVIGYSINNTIVIYDRIRETTPAGEVLSNEAMAKLVNNAVNDTLNRTFSSTLTTVFAAAAVWIFADGAVRTFAACVTVGVTIGAYSSILMAPTIYLWVRERFFKLPSADAPGEAAMSREEKERGVV